jgi:type II secretory pathway component PulC
MFKQLGIKNGDIVHSVNGQTLNDANKAAEAYGSLQGVSNFTFEVTRRNERQIFEYEVQ